MSVVALGTPGGLLEISSIALHVAAMWPRPVTVIEADPDGGRLAVRHNWHLRPGLAALTSSLRGFSNALAPVEPASTENENFGSTRGHIRVITAPLAPEEVIAELRELSSTASRLEEVLGTDVLISIGTIRPGSPATALIEAADARLLVMRCTVEDVAAVLHRRQLLQSTGTWTVLTAGGCLTTIDVARCIHWPVLADLLPSDRRNSLVLRQRIGELAATLKSEARQ